MLRQESWDTKSLKDFDAVYKRGLVIVDRLYRQAIADQIKGDKTAAKKSWGKYQSALSQILTLTVLHGEAVAYAAAQRAGLKIVPDPKLKKKPETFAERKATTGFEVGDFWEAIWGFKKKIPLASKAVQKAQLEMDELAAKIAKAESVNALKDLSARLEALRKTLKGSFRVKGATAAQAKKLKALIADAIIHKKLPEGLRTGGMSQFISRAQVEGIVGLTSARMETVYRTNVASAYNDATVEAMDKPAVQTWAPLLRLVEIHDSRTRGAPNGVYKQKGKSANEGFHWQMDGYIETAQRFKEQNLVPPNGFNCRGSLEPFTHDDAGELGLLDKDENIDREKLNRYNSKRQQVIDRGLYPDAGFK